MNGVSVGDQWEPLKKEARVGREAFVVTPFVRLARTHAAVAAGDASVAVALAGSLFFSIDPDEARWKVALYLALTLAPFAVVAPLIGPTIDRVRSGSRWVMLGTLVARSLVAFVMIRHIEGLLLFPLAFLMLVMSKAYSVAKSAYVPNAVPDSAALVRANSRLAVLAAVASPVGAAPAALLAWIGGSPWVVAWAMVVFAVGAVLASRLAPAGENSLADESLPTPVAWRARPEVPSSVRLGASAMGLVRMVVGFLTFIVAFELRSSGGTVGYGLVLGAVGAGALGGSVLAPVVRRHVAEERMLAGSLAVMGFGGLVGAAAGGLSGSMIAAGSVGVAAAGAKQAFDSLVQRDTPTADVGRVFAQNEARFQVLWVIGAIPPVVVAVPGRLGFLLLGVAAVVGTAAYLTGRQLFDFDRLRTIVGFGPQVPPPLTTGPPGPNPPNPNPPERNPPPASGPPVVGRTRADRPETPTESVPVQQRLPLDTPSGSYLPTQRSTNQEGPEAGPHRPR